LNLRGATTTIAPPGTEVTLTGNGCASRLVTVRPVMIPAVAPKTTSLNQWRVGRQP
jgi:hypothetical protein